MLRRLERASSQAAGWACRLAHAEGRVMSKLLLARSNKSSRHAARASGAAHAGQGGHVLNNSCGGEQKCRAMQYQHSVSPRDDSGAWGTAQPKAQHSPRGHSPASAAGLLAPVQRVNPSPVWPAQSVLSTPRRAAWAAAASRRPRRCPAPGAPLRHCHCRGRSGSPSGRWRAGVPRHSPLRWQQRR